MLLERQQTVGFENGMSSDSLASVEEWPDQKTTWHRKLLHSLGSREESRALSTILKT